jgi:hypothetical protein
MNNIEIIKAIAHLKPDAEYTFTEDDYSTIQWIKLEGTAPTIEELEAALKEIKAKEAKNLADEKTKKDALLERLGITADEISLLLK